MTWTNSILSAVTIRYCNSNDSSLSIKSVGDTWKQICVELENTSDADTTVRLQVGKTIETPTLVNQQSTLSCSLLHGDPITASPSNSDIMIPAKQRIQFKTTVTTRVGDLKVQNGCIKYFIPQTVSQSTQNNESYNAIHFTVERVSNADLQDSHFLYYVEKLLSMRYTNDNASTLYAWNIRFFETLQSTLENSSATHHQELIKKLIESLKEMSDSSAKQTYNIQRNIIIALLQGIYDMAITQTDTTTENAIESSKNPSKQSIDSWIVDSIYDSEVVDAGNTSYVVYTLQDTSSIKRATFHFSDKSSYSCMYQQCDRIAFPSTISIESIYYTTANGMENNESVVSGTAKRMLEASSYEEDNSIVEDNATSSDSLDWLEDELLWLFN